MAGHRDALALPSGVAMKNQPFCLSPASLLQVCLENNTSLAPLVHLSVKYHSVCPSLMDQGCGTQVSPSFNRSASFLQPVRQFLGIHIELWVICTTMKREDQRVTLLFLIDRERKALQIGQTPGLPTIGYHSTTGNHTWSSRAARTPVNSCRVVHC